MQKETSRIAANTGSMGASLQGVGQSLDSIRDNITAAETAIVIKIDQQSRQMQSMMERMQLSSLRGNAELEKLVRIGFWIDAYC